MKKSLKILVSKEKKLILNIIKEQWNADFKANNFAFLKSEKEKIYIVHKDVAKVDLSLYRINTVGMYFAEQKRGDFRLSIEGSQLIGPLAKKNIAELDDEEKIAWLRGEDIEKEGDWSGFVLIKHNNDFLGTGKYTADNRILNFVPKARRLILGELP
jgi:NOL1/NOP2/fmu family ribosome biogenesis protein